MAAKPARAFDVWFVTANTVYKAVPYNVVADWTQQGRLAPTDMVRPAGTEEAWTRVADHDLLADFVPRATTAKRVAAVSPVAAAAATEVATAGAPPAVAEGEQVELPEPEEPPSKSRFEDDDEVDMIPLIDISMVLLVFFILVQAAGALAPVDVPEMKFAGQLTADPDAITITIDKLNTDEVVGSERAEAGRGRAEVGGGRGPRAARRTGGRDARAGGAHRVPQGVAARARVRTAPPARTRAQEGEDRFVLGDRRGGTGNQMSAWLVRKEGSPEMLSLPSAAAVVYGLREGNFGPTDEVKGPTDADWLAIEAHPTFAEVAEEVAPPAAEADDTHLDMNPLIDVCLVLLIFFILTITYASLERALEVPGEESSDKGAQKEIPIEQIKDRVFIVTAKMDGDKVVIKMGVVGQLSEVPQERLFAEMGKLINSTGRKEMVLDLDDVPWGVECAILDAAKGNKVFNILNNQRGKK
jgi:biopolymer transport protein ExbD